MRTTAKNDPQFRTSLGRVVVRSSGWVEALLVCACAFFLTPKGFDREKAVALVRGRELDCTCTYLAISCRVALLSTHF